MVATILATQYIAVWLVVILFHVTLVKVIWWTVMGDWPASIKQENFIQNLANRIPEED